MVLTPEEQHYQCLYQNYTRTQYENMLRGSFNTDTQVKHSMKCWDYWYKKLSEKSCINI